MPPDVTLKEFMGLRFDGLDDKVGNLDKKVGDLDKRVKALEHCISNDVKHAMRIWRYIAALFVAILTALAIAWLRQVLGL